MATKHPTKGKGSKAARPHPAANGGQTAVAIPKRIRDLAFQLIGTERGAEAWLAMRNPELGNQTPAELIAAGQSEMVESFIQANLSGNFG
jgi:hypothetical protein